MDLDQDMIASAFSDWPGPVIMLERSETCATRKLTQCTDFGISLSDVSDKFLGGSGSTDLSDAEFRARKTIIKQVEGWCDRNAKASKAVVYNNEWTPILYKFEIVKTSAKKERDWGHLLFSDVTLSRFMLVMIFPEPCTCGTLSHHDYGALTRYHADRLMSLLIYLNGEWDWGNKPRWIRATYVAPKEGGFKLSSEFLDTVSLAPGEIPQTGRPSIHVVTPNDFNPTLLPNELDKIDNTVARGATPSTRKGRGVRRKVLGTKDDRPEVGAALKGKNMRECVFCKKVKEVKELRVCKGCRLVWYCSQECQRAAWPYHKVSCSKTVAETTSGAARKAPKKASTKTVTKASTEPAPKPGNTRPLPLALAITIAVAIALAAVIPLLAEGIGIDLR